MSYDVKDRSVHDGAPIECYHFQGSHGDFLYTSYQRPITVNDLDFEPIAITRTALETGTIDDSATTMDFNVPANCLLALRYAYVVSPKELTVTVYRVHEGDDYSTDYKIEFQGEALEFTGRGKWMTVRTGTLLQTKLNGNMSAVVAQRMCNHVLYDDLCKVDPAGYTFSSTVLKVQGRIVTVDDDHAANGTLLGSTFMIDRTGEKLAIITNDDNVLRVSVAAVDIMVGDTVKIILGCDHIRLGDCKNRFNNVVNYGGFDFIPTQNPFFEFTKLVNTSTTTTVQEEQVEQIKNNVIYTVSSRSV